MLKKITAEKKIFLFNMFIMLLFTKSVRWTANLSIKRTFCIVMLYFILLFIIPLFVHINYVMAEKIDHIFEMLINGIIHIKNNWKSIIKKSLIYFLAIFLSYAISILFSELMNQNYNYLVTYFLIGFFDIFITTYFLRKSISTNPEHLFFCILMIVGILYSCAMTCNVGITWDDQIHYQRIVSIVDFANNTTYKAETDVINTVWDKSLDNKNLNMEDNISFSNDLNLSYKNDETVDYIADYGIYSIAYVPYASGIIFGRSINLPFTWQLELGKVFNLLFYGIVISFAIKKIKSGKLLLAVIGLFPTMIFQTVNYSYDSWVACLIMYGFASFFGIIQNKNRKVEGYDVALMLIAFILGCLPKAIYFIMMIPLFFLPMNRFHNKREYQEYLIFVLCSGLLLACTFALPMLVNGAGTGDSRGGSNVNATEQIKFILSNPIKYIEILFNFMKDYLSLQKANGYIQSFAYLGDGIFSTSSLIIIGSVALLDKGGNCNINKRIRFSTLFGCISALCLVATALYISFTPVGDVSIAGCQPRYIVPALYPILYMITPNSVVNNIEKKSFYSLPMIFMAMTFLIDWVILVNPYVI